ncbi:phosphopantetheine-binding protein [Archangium lansingense]|uniref:Phosphopantetheine-binding protein n=1 Tax=Archangium lansingense TaxID=2995310 RepID=A0ABT4AEX4_9BACT|nr:phosphopantetheine-binding protein [Archangium lansinium]MCY1079447.1 phosphopantetheine-binding protein [Archangium lansinium]
MLDSRCPRLTWTTGSALNSQAYVAPRSSLEAVLAQIWAVLKIRRIGVHDDFFALGGHSLLATQVMSRIRSTFKVDLPVRCLFDTPTLEGLATALLCSRAQHVGPKCWPSCWKMLNAWIRMGSATA